VDIEAQSPLTRRRRRIFILDPSMRWPALVAIGGISAAAGLLLWMRSVLFGESSANVSSDDLGRLALVWHGLYFVTALGAVVWYAVILSHRVAGPTRVIEHALEGILQNDFERRLTLRKKDQLKGIAAGVEQVARRIQFERDDLKAFVQELSACLAREDVAGARRALASFRTALKLGGDVPPVPAGAAVDQTLFAR
jgi:hypothetical protein